MTLILCCGNRARGDDAAGILVAERLAALGIPAQTCSGGAFELIDAWGGSDHVVVVDAVVTGSRSGTIHLWDANESLFPPSLFVSTHGFGPAQAVALARTLGRLPPRLRIWGIEGKQFGMGTAPSAPVKQAANELAAQLAMARKSPPKFSGAT